MDEAPFVRGERQLQIPPLRFAAVGMTAVGGAKLGVRRLGCAEIWPFARCAVFEQCLGKRISQTDNLEV